MEESEIKKKYRFPGYDGALPKAMRSSRGRRTFQKKLSQAPDDLHCIDLLATVAGEVLQAKTVQREYVVTQNVPGSEIGSKDGDIGSGQADLPSVQVCNFEYYQGPSKIFEMICKDSGKVISKDSLEVVCLQNVENELCANSSKSNVGSCCKKDSSFEDISCPKGDGSNHTIPLELAEPVCLDICMDYKGQSGSDANCSIFKDRCAEEEGSCMTLLQGNGPPPVSSGSSEEAQTLVHKQLCDQCRELHLEGHLGYSQDLVRLKARDDDDKFSNSVVPVTTSQQRPPQIQELLGEELSVAVSKRKVLFTDGAGKKSKKQLLSQHSQGAKRWQTCGSCKQSGDLHKSIGLTALDVDAKDASVASSPTTTSKGSWKSAKRKSKVAHESSPVKVNITSFRVPELSINLPETATIANLKRAVMDAAVNLLGGGLHVRVLHHGKKVYDENSTLVQMGISCKERLESLAFMLEPNGVSNPSMNIGESVIAYPKVRSQPATWFPYFTLSDDIVSGVRAEADTSRNLGMQEKSEMVNKVGPEPQQGLPCELSQPTGAAVILHPGIEDKEPADIVTAQQDLGSLGGKRRTRRPFTVMEVEALVQAVELLGTGRWREVKQQVFRHARHRTYVDLKDKWKTLVHTAHIAPQQRRGEPVPQELLDRVLQAHTYWAVQLAKQQEDLGI